MIYGTYWARERKSINAFQSTLITQALKSAERKTKETLKEVATAATINKARKTYWYISIGLKIVGM